MGQVLYVPLPTETGREAILRTLTRAKPLAEDVDLGAVARDPAAASFSGADLDFLVREACMPAVLVRLLGLSHDNLAGRMNCAGHIAMAICLATHPDAPACVPPLLQRTAGYATFILCFECWRTKCAGVSCVHGMLQTACPAAGCSRPM